MYKLWTTCLITVISVARIGMGLFAGISGPTMLYLAENVDSSVYMLSYIFMGRSIGILLGSIMGGVLKLKTGPKFSHLLSLGGGVVFLGVVALVVPWIRNLLLLIFNITIGGLMYGYLDAGLQALILDVWGEKGSRSHIQLFHFMFCVGALIAPILARPFLAMADSQIPTAARCSNHHPTVLNSTSLDNFNYTAAPPIHTVGFNPAGWAYIIAALWMIIVGITTVGAALSDIEAKASSAVISKGLTPEKRSEEKLGDVIWVFLPVLGFYFCSVSTEHVYYDFIYSVSMCSDLKFSVTSASYLNSLTWLGVAAGRLTGTFAANYLKPRTIIIWSIAGSILDTLVMIFFGEKNAWLAWVISFLHGFTPSMLYPSGVSWLSQITNVSGFYMFIFCLGSSLGVLTMVPLAGYIFDMNPFGVMYEVLTLASVNAVFFGLAVLAGKHHLKKISLKLFSKKPEMEPFHAQDDDIS